MGLPDGGSGCACGCRQRLQRGHARFHQQEEFFGTLTMTAVGVARIGAQCNLDPGAQRLRHATSLGLPVLLEKAVLCVGESCCLRADSDGVVGSGERRHQESIAGGEEVCILCGEILNVLNRAHTGAHRITHGR